MLTSPVWTGSEVEDAAQPSVDITQEVTGQHIGRLAQVALVQGDDRGDVDAESRARPVADVERNTLPGKAASAVFEVMTATTTVASRLAL